MANNKHFYRGEYQQFQSGGLSVHNPIGNVSIHYVQRVFKMAQIKLIWLICDIFGIPLTVLGIVANIDNIKSVILAILAIAYLMGTGYYRFRRLAQEERAREIDLWHKEMDKKDRMKKETE